MEAVGITDVVILNHSTTSHLSAHRYHQETVEKGETLLSRNTNPAVMLHCLYQIPAHSPSGVVNPTRADFDQGRGNVEITRLEGYHALSPAQEPQPKAGHAAHTERLAEFP